MHKPKISIIVPVYNVEQYLHTCLDSLVNQTFGDIEIVAVNDGSTDASLVTLQHYAGKDGRVSVIDKANEGVSAARNTALASIAGEYVMFVDGDDWIDPDTCEKALQTIEQYDCDVVMWSYTREFATHSAPKHVFPQDTIFHGNRVQAELHRKLIGGIGDELANPAKLDTLCTIWGKLYKTRIITDHNIQFEDIRRIGTYEDGIFNLFLFKYVTKVVYIHQFFYHYRKNNNRSLTSLYKPDFKDQWFTLFDLMEKYIARNKLPYVCKQAMNNRIAVSILGLGLNELKSDKSAVQKIQCIKQIINEMKFRKAYAQLDLRYFSPHWKLFFGCAKYNFALGLYLLLLAIQKIMNREWGKK